MTITTVMERKRWVIWLSGEYVSRLDSIQIIQEVGMVGVVSVVGWIDH